MRPKRESAERAEHKRKLSEEREKATVIDDSDDDVVDVLSDDEHDHHELEHAAMQCLNSPRHCRPPASFGITKAHAEWAKVKGAVKMAAIMHHKGA